MLKSATLFFALAFGILIASPEVTSANVGSEEFTKTLGQQYYDQAASSREETGAADEALLIRANGQLERETTESPRHSVLHDYLGRAYGLMAELKRSYFLAKKSLAQFRKAVALNGCNLEAKENLAEYLANAPWIAGGDTEEAKRIRAKLPQDRIDCEK